METKKKLWASFDIVFFESISNYFNLVLELQFDDFYRSMFLQHFSKRVDVFLELHCFTACIFNRHGRLAVATAVEIQGS